VHPSVASAPPPPAESPRPTPPASAPTAVEVAGLRRLAERLAATGGRLSAGPDGDRFVLAATVPARVPA
jgi:hypothetical protein